MSKLTAIYPQAIEHTKNKVMEDMNYYLETKESLPSFSQYLSDRGHYLEQIWVNIWLNKVTNDVPKNEKKSFYGKKGLRYKEWTASLLINFFGMR